MLYRNIELYHELGLDDTGTKIIDLRTTDPVSAIRLDFKGSNGATSNKENWLNDVVTKIEIVDGSDQLLSLSMKEAQALQFYNTGKTPYMRCEERGGGSYNEQVLLQFGRFLWDPEYYLDLAKFTNPQLKISTDEDAIRAMGDAGYVSGSLKCTINLHTIQEGAEAAKGFMMQKETYSFTTAASGDEHIDMPRDYPYVGLLLRAYKSGNDISENISELKFSCDAGRFVPIDKKVSDIYRMNEEDLGPVELRMQLYRKDGETVHHPLQQDPVATLQGDEHNNLYQCIYQWSGQFELHIEDDTGAAVTTEEWIRAVIKGSCLHSTVYLPFGLLSDPATYFDPKAWSDIDLVLTQAAADATAQVVLQQLRSYA